MNHNNFREYENNQKLSAELNELIDLITQSSKIPEIVGPFDFPSVTRDMMKGSKIYYSIFRPVFSIAGVPFFRRYNNRDLMIIRGKFQENGIVRWIGPEKNAIITDLLNLIKKIGISNVTEFQVYEIIDNSQDCE